MSRSMFLMEIQSRLDYKKELYYKYHSTMPEKFKTELENDIESLKSLSAKITANSIRKKKEPVLFITRLIVAVENSFKSLFR